MSTLILAFLIAIGVITSSEDFNNLTEEEKTHYTSQNFIDDEVIEFFMDNNNEEN